MLAACQYLCMHMYVALRSVEGITKYVLLHVCVSSNIYNAHILIDMYMYMQPQV